MRKISATLLALTLAGCASTPPTSPAPVYKSQSAKAKQVAAVKAKPVNNAAPVKQAEPRKPTLRERWFGLFRKRAE